MVHVRPRPLSAPQISVPGNLRWAAWHALSRDMQLQCPHSYVVHGACCACCTIALSLCSPSRMHDGPRCSAIQEPYLVCRDARTPIADPANRLSVRSYTPASGRTPEVSLGTLDVDMMLSPNTATPAPPGEVSFVPSDMLNGHLGHAASQVRRARYPHICLWRISRCAAAPRSSVARRIRDAA